MEKKKRQAEEAKAPKGTRLMDEEERVATLATLEESRAELKAMLD